MDVNNQKFWRKVEKKMKKILPPFKSQGLALHTLMHIFIIF